MFEELIAHRVIEWKKKGATTPFEVQLNPTNRCNLKCRFCWLRDFDDGGLNLKELSGKKYKQIVKECKELRVRVVEITGGGEPMMRRDLVQIMKLVKRYGIFGRLVTNGTLFNEKMVKEVVKIGWDEIVFSLDAPVKEVNDYLRGESFDKVVKTIKTLQLRKMKMKREKPMVHIHMVLCNKNYKLLPRMFEFVYNLGCRNLLIEPVVLLAKKTKAGKELLFKKKDEKSLLKALKEAKDVAYRHNFQTNVDKLELSLINQTSKMKGVVVREGKKESNSWASIPCYQTFYHMIIRPWGIVGPCCMFESSEESVEEKTLEEIWFGKSFETMRRKMLQRELPGFCSNCNPSQVQENRKIRDFVKRLI